LYCLFVIRPIAYRLAVGWVECVTQFQKSVQYLAVQFDFYNAGIEGSPIILRKFVLSPAFGTPCGLLLNSLYSKCFGSVEASFMYFFVSFG
jgi:hypothetical protein